MFLLDDIFTLIETALLTFGPHYWCNEHAIILILNIVSDSFGQLINTYALVIILVLQLLLADYVIRNCNPIANWSSRPDY